MTVEQSIVPETVRPDPARTERHRYPVWLEVPTRFGDLDSLGHLNNVAIAQLYEESRVRLSHTVAAQAGPGLLRLVLAAFNLHYLAETRYPEPVEVGIGVARIGRSSYTMGQVMYQGGRCVGLADSTLVHAPPTGVVPLPDDVRTILEGLRMA